jgi:hypothetical protein
VYFTFEEDDVGSQVIVVFDEAAQDPPRSDFPDWSNDVFDIFHA